MGSTMAPMLGRQRCACHRHAARKALFRSAEGDGDFIFLLEAEQAAAKHGEAQDKGQQNHVDADHDADIAQVNWFQMPSTTASLKAR